MLATIYRISTDTVEHWAAELDFEEARLLRPRRRAGEDEESLIT